MECGALWKTCYCLVLPRPVCRDGDGMGVFELGDSSQIRGETGFWPQGEEIWLRDDGDSDLGLERVREVSLYPEY